MTGKGTPLKTSIFLAYFQIYKQQLAMTVTHLGYKYPHLTRNPLLRSELMKFEDICSFPSAPYKPQHHDVAKPVKAFYNLCWG